MSPIGTSDKCGDDIREQNGGQPFHHHCDLMITELYRCIGDTGTENHDPNMRMSPDSISATSAIPDKSEPTLIVFAINRPIAPINKSQRGLFRRSEWPKPMPVTMPIRAHMN